MEKTDLWCKVLMLELEKGSSHEIATSIANKVVNAYEEQFDKISMRLKGHDIMTKIPNREST